MGVFAATARWLLARKDAGATVEELAAQTGWQASSVRTGISKARWGALPANRNSWTEAMVDVMALHWHSHNAAQIAQQIFLHCGRHVSADAVNAKAHRLGWAKPRLHANNIDWRRPNVAEAA